MAAEIVTSRSPNLGIAKLSPTATSRLVVGDDGLASIEDLASIELGKGDDWA
jgi:hypothetical protein